MSRSPRLYGRRRSDVLTIRYPAYRPDPDRDRIGPYKATMLWLCVAAMAIAIFLQLGHHA